MLTEADIAWLAGFIDGEGYVGAYRTKIVRERPYYTSTCRVVNTHQGSIERVSLLFEHICGHAPFHGDRQPKRGKHAWWVQMNASGDLLKLARTVKPYSVTKIRQWDLLEEFVQSRLLRLRTPIDAYELTLIDKLAALNRRWKEETA